jgi:hypothetical protein
MKKIKSQEMQIVDSLRRNDDYSIDIILETCWEPCLRLNMDSVKVALKKYKDYREYEKKIEHEKMIHERVMEELRKDREESWRKTVEMYPELRRNYSQSA